MLRFLQYSLEQVDPHVETLRAVWPAKAKWVLRDGQAVRRHVPTRCRDRRDVRPPADRDGDFRRSVGTYTVPITIFSLAAGASGRCV
jgi:hypothetical protein